MQEVEYRVVQVRSAHIRDLEDALNRLSLVEGWEVVTFFRGRPLRNNPAGRLYAVLKRPFVDPNR